MSEVLENGQVVFTEQDEKRASAYAGLRGMIPHKIMDDSTLHAAVGILHNPDFLNIIIDELGKKIAGEHYARTAIFLCACNIWVENSLQKTHVIVNSSSSAGKDHVTKAVFDLFPEGIKDYRSKITSETFSYWRTDKKSREENFTWDGRLLYLEDCSQTLLDSPTFRVMLSGGSKATVVRDQRAIDLHIPGRPTVMITTATTMPSNELLNRFVPVSLEETQCQTINVFRKEIELAMCVKAEYNPNVKAALLLLRKCRVKIPFAEHFLGLFPDKPVSMRREFARFLSFIQNSAALYQFQRVKDADGYVLADWQDYDNAVYGFAGIDRNPVKLTKSQQRVLDCFSGDGWYLRSEIASMVGMDSSWVYRILLQLVEKGLISVRLDDTEAKSKAKQIFAKVVSVSQLPKSDVLIAKLPNNSDKIAKIADIVKRGGD
ncbi:MAG: hypothetical protein QW165_04540 [Candidatus Woesearchaeota archaeon]